MCATLQQKLLSDASLFFILFYLILFYFIYFFIQGKINFKYFVCLYKFF